MRWAYILSIIVVLLAAFAVGTFFWASRYSEITRIDPPDPSSFNRDLVDKGKSLTGYGNCVVCHTREGGESFAGGLALPTPFGVIYTTNITPDPESGIGGWSEVAFRRAMHEGVDRMGSYLYPAFPYDHFTKVSDGDTKAIYAYLMSEVEPVTYEPPKNELAFPFNIRLGLSVWNALFLDKKKWKADPDQNEEWNRGAYLVEGLGHCSSCHSPRNFLGAEKTGADAYSGGVAEGWFAPALNKNSPAQIPWTIPSLVDYLLDGWDKDHGIAAGPMIPVVNALLAQSEDDVFAIAAYLLSLQGGQKPSGVQKVAEEDVRAFAEKMEWGHPENPSVPDDDQIKIGARVFEKQCSNCHKSGGKPVLLALTSSVNLPDPANVIHLILDGLIPPQGALGRSMPGRDAQISDEELVALLKFVRSRFSQQAPWETLNEKVRQIRHGKEAP